MHAYRFHPNLAAIAHLTVLFESLPADSGRFSRLWPSQTADPMRK
jgi:hypothetical protein